MDLRRHSSASTASDCVFFSTISPAQVISAESSHFSLILLCGSFGLYTLPLLAQDPHSNRNSPNWCQVAALSVLDICL